MEENKNQPRLQSTEIKLFDLSTEDGSTVLNDVKIRVPDRDTRDRYINHLNTDIGRANRVLLGYCLLSHKEEVNANDELQTAAVQAAASLVKMGTFKLKN